MGKCRAARYRSRCPGAIRGLGRPRGSYCDRGREHPLPAKISLGPWHCVQRARDECREIRGTVQRGRIDPDRMDDGDDTRRKTASAELDGERWSPVTPPAHKGFGSRVIERGLSHELEGAVHLDYRPDGLVCTMDIPLPRGARDG